jgi:hypothetical protein
LWPFLEKILPGEDSKKGIKLCMGITVNALMSPNVLFFYDFTPSNSRWILFIKRRCPKLNLRTECALNQGIKRSTPNFVIALCAVLEL